MQIKSRYIKYTALVMLAMVVTTNALVKAAGVDRESSHGHYSSNSSAQWEKRSSRIERCLLWEQLEKLSLLKKGVSSDQISEWKHSAQRSCRRSGVFANYDNYVKNVKIAACMRLDGCIEGASVQPDTEMNDDERCALLAKIEAASVGVVDAAGSKHQGRRSCRAVADSGSAKKHKKIDASLEIPYIEKPDKSLTGSKSTGSSRSIGGKTGTQSGTTVSQPIPSTDVTVGACAAPASAIWSPSSLTNFTSYPAAGSTECVNYSGCDYLGMFSLTGNAVHPESWVQAHNIIAVHSKDFNKYKGKTFLLRQAGRQISAVVYDECADSDCNGCCTKNAQPSGFLIDMEKYTLERFGGAGEGTVEWTCIDCDQPLPSGCVVGQ